jgi:serine/threonine-protein kinase
MPSQPEVERALIRASTTPSREDAERFYAQRVASYARILATIFGALYLAGIVLTLTLRPSVFWEFHLHPAKLYNLGFPIVLFAITRALHGPHPPNWLAIATDVGTAPSTTLALVPLVHTVPGEFAIYAFPLLIAVIVLVLRAALVPSPPRRTLGVAIATLLPVLIATYLLTERAVPPPFFPPAVMTIGVAAWSVALAASTALVSRVIYGLERQIERARRLGQYELRDLIGEGGMGAVYHAQHALLRRPTALKLLLPERAGPENIQRFEREVQLTARLTHPNTIAIYDYGRTPDGIFYYAMEYLDGLSLEQLVTRFGAQPQARVIHLLLQAAGALQEAHSLGLIHRDVKPANILLCQRGGVPDVVKLLDFGLVKNVMPEGNPELTHAGTIAGTPQYLAPESLTAPDSIDPRVDLYALGGVGYFLLCGQPAFEGQSIVEICGHHLHSAPVPPSERLGAPVLPELESLILRCLAKDREQRPRDAGEVYEALLVCAQRAPWPKSDARRFWEDLRASRS